MPIEAAGWQAGSASRQRLLLARAARAVVYRDRRLSGNSKSGADPPVRVHVIAVRVPHEKLQGLRVVERRTSFQCGDIIIPVWVSEKAPQLG